VILGAIVNTKVRAERGTERRAPPQDASRSPGKPALQGERPTGRSFAGRLTSTPIAQNPKRRQGSPRPRRSARDTNGRSRARAGPRQPGEQSRRPPRTVYPAQLTSRSATANSRVRG